MSYSRLRYPSTVVVLLLSLVVSSTLAGDVIPMRGKVFNRREQPVPGCTVFLVSTSFRTSPAITNSDGSYVLEAPTDPQGGPTFVEVYFGKQLVFRQPLKSPMITSDALYKGIDLPPIYLALDSTKESAW
jgi:hypothetical protein